MKALREGKERELGGLTGKYETAYGTTEPVENRKGLRQGDLLSPVSRKVMGNIELADNPIDNEARRRGKSS
eukprot:4901075-Pleurochrysis_carterae.AAC.1